MASQVDVINVALRRVGGNRIVSITEDSASASISADLYDAALDDLLRQHFWNFATKRAKLARLVDTPVFEFDYAYTVPQDWIRTVSVHPDDSGRQHMVYKEEEIDDKRVIITSEEDVYMRYIRREADPNKWSNDFRQAMSMVLARDLAIPIANSNSLLDRLDTLSRAAIARARSTDAMGSTPEQLPRGSWVRNRGGGRGLNIRGGT